jgi:hypothetical protein
MFCRISRPFSQMKGITMTIPQQTETVVRCVVAKPADAGAHTGRYCFAKANNGRITVVSGNAMKVAFLITDHGWAARREAG